MPDKTDIKLVGTDLESLNKVCNDIKEIARKAGVEISGPIPLPTKKLQISTLRTPCGDGSKTWYKYEMRIHKRLIRIDADERVLRQIMRIQIPEKVHIEIELKTKEE
ncbi:MAG: 30S ribosomal protein S10 [archaeon]